MGEISNLAVHAKLREKMRQEAIPVYLMIYVENPLNGMRLELHRLEVPSEGGCSREIGPFMD